MAAQGVSAEMPLIEAAMHHAVTAANVMSPASQAKAVQRTAVEISQGAAS